MTTQQRIVRGELWESVKMSDPAKCRWERRHPAPSSEPWCIREGGEGEARLALSAMAEKSESLIIEAPSGLAADGSDVSPMWRPSLCVAGTDGGGADFANAQLAASAPTLMVGMQSLGAMMRTAVGHADGDIPREEVEAWIEMCDNYAAFGGLL